MLTTPSERQRDSRSPQPWLSGWGSLLAPPDDREALDRLRLWLARSVVLAAVVVVGALSVIAVAVASAVAVAALRGELPAPGILTGAASSASLAAVLEILRRRHRVRGPGFDGGPADRET